MEWKFFVALIAAIPIMLFPVVFFWYSNERGFYHALKGKIKRKISDPASHRKRGGDR